jgi:hypothetical protein
MAPKLPMQAVKPTKVSFSLDRAGSFKMEPHHLEDHRDLELPSAGSSQPRLIVDGADIRQ